MRTCDHCGKKPMTEGYCIDNGCEYYCSDECLHANISKEDYEKLYDNGNGDSYWTEWEDDGIDEAECKCCGQDLEEGYYILINNEPLFYCDSGCLRKDKMGVYNNKKVHFTLAGY